MAGHPDWWQLGRRGAVAVGLSVIANVLVLTIVLETGAVEAFDPLSYPPVVFLTASGAIGAAAVYALVAWRYQHPDPLFVRIAAVVLALSFVPDGLLLVSDPSATLGGVAVLVVMHVIAAVVCIAVLTDQWP